MSARRLFLQLVGLGLAGLLLAILAPANLALAANWLQLFGNEPAAAPAFRPLLIFQPTYTHLDAEPVSGLRGPLASYNGQLSSLNSVLPDFDRSQQLQMLRARIGARGKLSEQINYFALVEAGKNPMTSQQDLVLSSLSLTFNHIPGARIRAGLFKLPTDEEALVAVNLAYPYTFFSAAVQNLLIEQPLQAGARLSPSLTAASASSGCNCFHDWGIQVYDWFQQGDWEWAYAAVLSNGNAIDSPSDDDGNKDLTLRLQASYVFAGEGPQRQDLTAYVWRQEGDRRFAGADQNRLREGLGLQLNRNPLRLSAAYLRGEGMISGGFNPPFAGESLLVGANETAEGWYLEGGWRFHPRWELDLRRDRFDGMTRDPVNGRRLDTTTLGLQHRLNKRTRLSLNYEWRQMEVMYPQAFATTPSGQTQLHNARTLADNLADRLSLQLSWTF
ncbi:MAG: hypothetical protein HQL47_00950 [Gammaproteobacteria bacterium]|nr:hypothetical protein [Gammaproteobacteria bacterium]